MEIKKGVPNNTITRDVAKLASPTGNIYESIVIVAKRANQISAELKQELENKLSEFSKSADTLEETFENREQIEISRYYEKLPKATLLSINEFEEGKIYWRKVV
jgi:DNA-directed RNA polymerase subunit K/omega